MYLALTLLQLLLLQCTSSVATSVLTIDNNKNNDIDVQPSVSASVSASASAPLTAPAVFQLTKEQLETYKRDGVLIIRGLLKGEELNHAIREAKQINKKTITERILRKFFKSGYDGLRFQTWRKFKSMEYIAFDSPVPSIVAQLMGYASNTNKNKSTNKSIRLLKDAFLAYQEGGKGCGWHVDDKGFWPCEDSPLHTPDAGVNVWITLSPLRASEGGGLAVAPSSHAVSWREDARSVIASPTNGPMPLTCAMEDLSPEYHRKFEEMKLTLDMEPGDAIIHDRYMFHRTVQFKDEGKKGLFSRWRKRTKLRISLRYMPSDANLFVMNKMFDQAFEEKDLMTGDKIEKGEEYFPQVWPTSLSGERKKEVKKEEGLYTLSFMFKMLKQASKK